MNNENVTLTDKIMWFFTAFIASLMIFTAGQMQVHHWYMQMALDLVLAAFVSSLLVAVLIGHISKLKNIISSMRHNSAAIAPGSQCQPAVDDAFRMGTLAGTLEQMTQRTFGKSPLTRKPAAKKLQLLAGRFEKETGHKVKLDWDPETKKLDVEFDISPLGGPSKKNSKPLTDEQLKRDKRNAARRAKRAAAKKG